MIHRRSPTHSYPHPATLALRYPHPSIPTLLSPLISIANSPLDDAPDDFQSNAWFNAPLAGLGITYFRDTSSRLHGQPPALGDSLRMQINDSERVPSLPAESHPIEMSLDDFPVPSVPYRGLQRSPRHPTPPTYTPVSRVELGLDSDIDPMASDIIGLIPDVNMYDKFRRLDMSHTGVNPLDTISDTSCRSPGISYREPTSLTPNHLRIDGVPFSNDPRPEEAPSPRVIQDILSILIKPVAEPSSQPRPAVDASSPPARFFSPPQLATPSYPTSVKFQPLSVPNSEDHPLSVPCDLEHPNSTQSSPVLNAHLGIELSELMARAERFRNRHPERDIDRAWLSHFAGKLSDRGELLNDFRCYVIGCDQRNKRRDHILVHVGAHIGQRPFACSLCPHRFLRKNECKRHEASHTGFRPYSCDICGQSFVRQDLVKRHVKRTHGQKDENHPGATKRSAKKRARLR